VGYRGDRRGYFVADDLLDDLLERFVDGLLDDGEVFFVADFVEAGLAFVDLLLEVVLLLAGFSAADRIADNFFRWVAVSTFSIAAISESCNSSSCFSKASTFSR
jgi:hypothetical protein